MNVLYLFNLGHVFTARPATTCSRSTMDTLEQCVKSIQSQQYKHQSDVAEVLLVSLLLTLNKFHTLFWCFLFWLWTSKCRLGGCTKFRLEVSSSDEIFSEQLQGLHSEPCQISKMECFTKTIFTKCSILDVWQSSKYASVITGKGLRLDHMVF